MGYKSVKALVVAALLAAGLAACVPLFGNGAVLTVTPLGSLATISWPAVVVDADKTVTEYRIDVDGTEYARVSGATLSCVVTGLPLGTSGTIAVSAYDSAGQWGGDATSGGYVTAGYTTPASAVASGPHGCVATTDTDSDRLPDAVETNNGAFTSAAATGTNPNVADTDTDGMDDGDEVFGTTGGVDLHAMGASPTKKDLAFEFDWFDDNADAASCAAHSHRPTPAVISKVTTAYGNAPVANPDGTTGIHVIADYGQGGAFTGGNLIADADGVIAGGVNGADYTAAKSANFNANRQGLFHYVLNVHRYNVTSTSSGQAEINGNDLVVSLYCFASMAYSSSSDQYVANTILHENGHNLGLRHGGNVDTNYKPNYNSIMNYQFQFPGVDTNCDRTGDNVLDYSTGARATLNEAALLETDGICSGVDIDWNGNAVIDAGPIARDINQDGLATGVHADHDDWANISLTAVNNGASPDGRTAPEIIDEQPVPLPGR